MLTNQTDDIIRFMNKYFDARLGTHYNHPAFLCISHSTPLLYISAPLVVQPDAVSDYYTWICYKRGVARPASTLNANNKKLNRMLVEFARGIMKQINQREREWERKRGWRRTGKWNNGESVVGLEGGRDTYMTTVNSFCRARESRIIWLPINLTMKGLSRARECVRVLALTYVLWPKFAGNYLPSSLSSSWSPPWGKFRFRKFH